MSTGSISSWRASSSIAWAHGARRPGDERPTWDVGQEHLGVFSAVDSGLFPSTGIDDRIGAGCVLSRRPRWDVLRSGAFIVPPRSRLLLRMRRHRRIERAQDARTHLGRESPVQHHGAVVLVPEREAAVLVLGVGPFGLLRALRPPMEADELLDMLRRAVQADVQEIVLVLGSGDAGQCPDLGVAELASGERLREQRQFGQGAGDADLLPSGMGIDAARPAQPMSAGQRPLSGPDLASVELGDECEETPGGGVDVSGEGGDGGGERVVVHGGEIVCRSGMQIGHGVSR